MRTRVRQLLLGLVLLAYLMAGHGVMPSASMLARWSPLRERFPCEGCACGCVSARDCWTNCCCHSVGQRLAWARRHGVTPPAYATAAIEHELEATPSCPMCDAAGDDADPPPGPGGVMSALGCRGISNWIVFAAPDSCPHGPGPTVIEPRQREALNTRCTIPMPNGVIEVPTPPPRAA